VTYAKANPSKVDYGTSGVGTLNHLLMEEFKAVSGVPSMAVPYRSIAQAFTDSIGGQISVVFPGLSAALPHIREGSFKPLAITGDKRNPILPNVPTFKESGYDGFNRLTWYGIVGPPGLPTEIRNKLNNALAQILAKPEVQKSLSEQAIYVMPMSPDRFEKYITEEVKHWTKVANDSKVEAE
jgi:tripartite-type tricarboxylate transporter receptor subunit TctC